MRNPRWGLESQRGLNNRNSIMAATVDENPTCQNPLLQGLNHGDLGSDYCPLPACQAGDRTWAGPTHRVKT